MESMHDEELLYYSLKRIASTIERIINNSKAIDDSQYYAMLLHEPSPTPRMKPPPVPPGG